MALELNFTNVMQLLHSSHVTITLLFHQIVPILLKYYM
jgi:hypothetical protein